MRDTVIESEPPVRQVRHPGGVAHDMRGQGGGSGHGGGKVQLKAALRGKGFAEQEQMLAPVQRSETDATRTSADRAAAESDTPTADGQTTDSEPLAASSSPLTLSVENRRRDPSSGANERTTVGVGEECWFFSLVGGGTWKHSGGRGEVVKAEYKWSADTAGTYAITYTLGDRSVSTTMTVVAPEGIAGSKTAEYSYGAGLPGSGMTLNLITTPTTVSFSDLYWLEEQGSITGEGILKDKQPPIRHNAKWSAIGVDNRNEIPDTAEMSWTKFGPGKATYMIKQLYRVGTSGKPTHYATLAQEFEIFDADGTMQTRKAGQASNKRKP